jgi:Rps23 Pro-64 3,4-dihydroxylase Tpa1-like proline 4-hydroxylase
MDYEIPHENIVYFKGVITNIKEIIELIESLGSKAVSPWEVWYAHNDTHEYGSFKSLRRSLLEEESDLDIKSRSAYLIQSLTDYMAQCASKYSEIYGISPVDLEYAVFALNHEQTKFGINKYFENRHMGPHVDWNEFNSDIRFTIVVYLNDDYEGGEIYFNNQDVKIKPQAGSIVMFPSKLPYLHESLNITKGRKMLITHHWKGEKHAPNEQ